MCKTNSDGNCPFRYRENEGFVEDDGDIEDVGDLPLEDDEPEYEVNAGIHDNKE